MIYSISLGPSFAFLFESQPTQLRIYNQAKVFP